MSSKQYLIISLSDSIPKALITINKGIGFFTFGIATTICPFFFEGEGAIILIATVLTGLEASSDTERTSAL